MKIWTSSSLSEALRCLPAIFAAKSLFRASSRALDASEVPGDFVFLGTDFTNCSFGFASTTKSAKLIC